ncbi:MAG TPA: hypothetical protein DCE35_14110, partial [Alcanivorax sp.]|nr:hypothetical protein [Alcanivorax sp.]
GYSWLYGNFNEFTGSFTVDEENPENSKVRAEIKTASIDSNHAERDKHLRSDDFLDVSEYPTATFESTRIEQTGERTAKITGD